MTDPGVLAQDIADHFKPPYTAEEYEYVRDENGKLLREPDSNFRAIKYLKREFRETISGAAMITERAPDGGISIRPLTWYEIAQAVAKMYDLEPKNATLTSAVVE